MTLPIATVINSIIHEKGDVCCLCLTSVEDNPFHFTDTIVADINNEECDRNVEYILKSIFDDEICNYVATLDILCQNCVMLAYTFTKFKEACKINTECIKNTLIAFCNTFGRTPNVPINSKSLYTSLNTEDLSSKQYYDLKYMPPTKRLALIRLRELNNSKRFCQECQREFSAVSSLKEHMLQVHKSIKRKCPHCRKYFNTTELLQEHKLEHHSHMKCGTCGKIFYNKDRLMKHEQYQHQIICQDCGRAFKLRSSLNRHKKQNSCSVERARPLQGNYKCHYCDKRYHHKMSLIVHLRLHENGKTYDCEYCDKKFTSQSALTYHLVKHTRERDFLCTICGGKFVTREALLYHTRLHTGEKPYKCPHCDLSFLNSSRRSTHVNRVHLKSAPTVICVICDRTFKSKGSLIRHRKLHHLVDNSIKIIQVKSELQSTDSSSEVENMKTNLNTKRLTIKEEKELIVKVIKEEKDYDES